MSKFLFYSSIAIKLIFRKINFIKKISDNRKRKKLIQKRLNDEKLRSNSLNRQNKKTEKDIIKNDELFSEIKKKEKKTHEDQN